jgi:non-ribosomal peptide synthetase component F
MLRSFYYRSRFSDETVTRLLHHYRNAMEQMAAAPQRRLRDVRLLTEQEWRRVVVEWNESEGSFAVTETLHQRFEAQAAQTPDAVALVYEREELSYRDLNSKANRLAHHLRKLGAGPEVAVGLCMERSLDLVIGLLAILKAGGAYVPLDPRYPQTRLSFMLQDAKVGVLLAQQRLAESLGGLGETRLVCVDSQWEEIAVEPDSNLAAGAIAENLAYVIYTSGSTGNPKGVLVTHANVTRLFDATQKWFEFGQSDVWTLFHSHAFDFSVWELWGALLYGGRLVVVPYGVSRSPERFYELLKEHRVTVLNQTPSAFRQLVAVEESEPPEDLALRSVIFGGEALELQNLKGWF